MDDDATFVRPAATEPTEPAGVLSNGTRLGDYRIVRMLGRGGMGEVYEAEHEWLAQRYALKVLPSELSQAPGFRRRFEQEARTLASLRHEHIVSVHNAGESGGCFYLVMDLLPRSLDADLRAASVEGTTARPRAGQRLEPARVHELLLQMLDALAHAHARGIVHRDLKPANILLDAQGRVRLADFGVARVVGEDFVRSLVERTVARSVMAEAATRVSGGATGGGSSGARSGSGSGSRDAALVGTIDYMAPEVRSGGEADARADLYAAGVIAYELLTGRKPLGMAKPPSRLVPGLAPAWDGFVERALEVEPADRWASAEEMRAALAGISAGGEGAMAGPEAAPDAEEIARPMAAAIPPPLPSVSIPPLPTMAAAPANPVQGQSRRLLPIVSGLIALVAVGLFAFGTYSYLAESRRAEQERLRQIEEEERRQQQQDKPPPVPDAPVVTDPVEPGPTTIGPVDQPVIDTAPVEEPIVPASEPVFMPTEGESWFVPDIGLSVQWVQPGAFVMGSPDYEANRQGDEGPQTTVSFSSGFWLGSYEVTQSEWMALMGSNPSTFQHLGDRAPVEGVSWGDAMDFCRRLTERERAAGRLPEGYVYTLPTEAQWEYACRAGTTTPYSWGYTFDLGVCNIENDEGTAESANVDHFYEWELPVDSTMEVGQFLPNAWGFYDMHGNVQEWCLDWYSSALPAGEWMDPTGPADGTQRIYRGGSWWSSAATSRAAYRGANAPDERNGQTGFRVALSRSTEG